MNSQRPFLDQLIQNRVISHLLFWVSLFIILTTSSSLSSGAYSSSIYNYLALLPAQIMAAYLLNYYQIPQLLYKKKYLGFALSLIVSIYILSALGRISIVHISEPFFREDFTQESIAEIASDVSFLVGVYFPSVYTYAFVMLMIKAVKNRFNQRHQIAVLQQEKAQHELKFLKAQIQPHFLFNTLNNLYALTLSKSDLAPEVVLKLSSLLDFVLYQSNTDAIAIEKEIELIQNFLELESLRYGPGLDLSFEKSIDRSDATIAPLLLLPLVENAFKHGYDAKTSTSTIRLQLHVTQNLLRFEVYNTKPPVAESRQSLQKKGIGLVNLKRQLELHYPKAHRLHTQETEKAYEVQLEIDLAY